MPIYEYRCEPCDHEFETLVRSSGDTPHCPKCGGIDHLSKQFSVPASAKVGEGASSSSLPMAGPGPCGMGGCGSGMCSM